MTGDYLKLLFPQWQGSGIKDDLYRGALLIRDRLLSEEKIVQVNIETDSTLSVENNIFGYSQILKQLRNAVQLLKETLPKKIFTIGGDCGVEIAPVSFLNKIYANDIAVLWFDAHGDLNTPEASSSKLFHGMPLSYLIGEEANEIQQNCFSRIAPSQILFAGTRDLDAYEESYIREKSISVITVKEISENKNRIIELLKLKSYKKIYIHIDLDVLEPDSFPYVMCPSPNGIDMILLLELLESIKRHFIIIGLSIVEFLPLEAKGTEHLRELIKFGCTI